MKLQQLVHQTCDLLMLVVPLVLHQCYDIPHKSVSVSVSVKLYNVHTVPSHNQVLQYHQWDVVFPRSSLHHTCHTPHEHPP